MGKQERVKQIAALKAANLPPLTWRDVFTPTEGADPISAKDQAAMDAYFSVFVAWPKNDNGESVCICCRKIVRGGLMGGILGGAPNSTTFPWGFAHGECSCNECGWPSRAIHYDIGGKGDDALVQRLNLNLLYHPSGIEVASDELALQSATGSPEDAR